MKHLILGGVRSGKSRYALSLVNLMAAPEKTPTFIATAEAFDTEFAERILRHQQERSANWNLIETPLELASVINSLSSQDVAIIDCLTLWLNNVLYHAPNLLPQYKNQLIEALSRSEASIVIVSNEVGYSITPDNPLAREFADQQGWLNQAVAAICDKVTLTVAGLPLDIK